MPVRVQEFSEETAKEIPLPAQYEAVVVCPSASVTSIARALRNMSVEIGARPCRFVLARIKAPGLRTLYHDYGETEDG